MLAQTIVISVGLAVCLVGFVLVFEIKDGQGPSNITGVCKRRLTALTTLSAADLIFLVVWFLIQHGLSWSFSLIPMVIGVALSAVGLAGVTRIQSSSADGAAAVLTKLERWGMATLFLALSACFIYLLIRLPNPQDQAPQKTLATTFLILVVAAIAVPLVYSFVKEKPDSLDNDADSMPITTRRVLAFYLLFIGISLGALLWRIGFMDFSESGLDIETETLGQTMQKATVPSEQSGTAGATTPSAPHAAAPESTLPNPQQPRGMLSTTPVLYELFAQTTLTAAPVVYVTAYGDNFTTDSKIRFNQQEQPTVFVEPKRIQAQLDQAVINSSDPILVDVLTNKQVTSAIAMWVTKSRVTGDLLGWHFTLTRELQLLLLAILAGGLGSYIHSIKSFGHFVGNRTLTTSWFWWYITRPFLGAALAVVFYAVLRGGFMAGTPADAKAVNQFGVIAVAALVGMFADKASDKLAAIFDTLFKGADDRTGKLGAPVIDRLDPAVIDASKAKAPVKLRIIGDRLGTVAQVKFNDKVHEHEVVSQKEITVSLLDEDISGPRTIKVSVVGDNGESPTKNLEIK